MKKNVYFLFFLLILSSCGDRTFKQGKILYQGHCANCHMDNGKGLRSLIPPLAGVNYFGENRAMIACIIRNGLKDTIFIDDKIFSEEMLPIPTLNEAEITNIINYINQAWHNDLGYVQLNEVKEALQKCE